MPQGEGRLFHNRREYEKEGKTIPENINTSKSHENITLIDRDIKQAYNEIFGDALKKYNAKQKRSDRKIASYYEHIQNSKNGEKLFYEDVVQWGSKEDFQSPQTRERAKEALIKYVEGFEDRNPNLKLIGAYIHMDEASPHLHLDYIPIATGYTRGLEVRNSLDKAMKQMGFVPENESRKDNATKMWQINERAVFADICRGFGLEVEAEQKARGSLSVAEYKKVKDEMIGEIEHERDALVAQIKPLRELKTGIDEIADVGTTVLPGVVALKKKDFELLSEQAKAYTVNRNDIATLRNRSVAVKQRERAVEQREQQLIKREEEIREKYNRQLNLNQLLEQSEKSNQTKDEQIAELQAENSNLRGQIAKLWERIKTAYRRLTDIVKAVGMLKYGKDNGYKVLSLTEKQERLIDGISEYGVKCTKDADFPEMAKDMEQYVGISEDIRSIVEPVPKHSYEHNKGRSL